MSSAKRLSRLRRARVAQKVEHRRSADLEALAEQRERPDGSMEDEEKILAGRPDTNIPAMLTKDVRGG